MMKVNENMSPKDVLSSVGSSAKSLGKRIIGIQPSITEILPRLTAVAAEQTYETAKMWNIYCNWSTAEPEDRQFANEQIKNLLKTAGLAGIVVLPGTPLILPALVKLAKKAGVNILPDWVEKEMNR